VVLSCDGYVFAIGIVKSQYYYKQESRKHGLNPKSSRTFSNYVNELIELGYLKVERAKVRGNVRKFELPQGQNLIFQV
jgi:Cdc6-like AAA superfamily ATPase